MSDKLVPRDSDETKIDFMTWSKKLRGSSHGILLYGLCDIATGDTIVRVPRRENAERKRYIVPYTCVPGTMYFVFGTAIRLSMYRHPF